MGNNSSKPSGEAPASPVANHPSSRSSTLNSKSSSSRKKASTLDHSNNAHTPQIVPQSPTSSIPQPSSICTTFMGNEHSKLAEHHDHRKKSRSKATPVKVPHRASDSKRQRGPDTQFEPSGPPRDPNFIPHSNFGLPPRLPLPIGEELHTPGSPIIDAQGSTALHEHGVGGALPRPVSTISNTTLEDDELGSDIPQYPDDGGRGTVPTLVYWKQGGEKVYVTGTFTGWSRKYRMNREYAFLLQLALPFFCPPKLSKIL